MKFNRAMIAQPQTDGHRNGITLKILVAPFSAHLYSSERFATGDEEAHPATFGDL